MSDPNSNPESSLDAAIADVLARLSTLAPEEKEYADATDQLVKLHRLKQEDDKLALEAETSDNKFTLERQKLHQEQLDATRPKSLSKDTLIVAGANILGIALIIWHERDHVMNRNALDFSKRLR